MGKRDNGSGTIRMVKGANGTRYYAYAPAKYVEQPDGSVKCVREALGWRTKKSDAKALLDDYQQHPTMKFNHTLQMVFEEWKPGAYADIGKSTQDGYSAAWQQILWANAALANKSMKDITTSEIRSIYDFWMEQHTISVRNPSGTLRDKKVGPLSKSSMQKIKALFTQLYSFSVANNIVTRNLASLVKLPRDAEDGQGRAFTDAEFAVLQKSWKRVPGADAIFALCYLGFRITEFCKLTPADYDPASRTLRGGIKTKAGKNRIVPVHPAILPLVESWVAVGRKTLYADPDGKPYTKDTFRLKVWQPAMAALGLPDDLTPHSCRHTCGTRLAAAGARPEDIQRILGHSDYSETANVYINQDAATLTAAMSLMK